MNHPARKACGILFCYNEEHILAESVRHYLNQGIDLVLIDNDSSDSSVEIARSFQTDASSYRGRLIDIQRIETDGYEWRKILQFACQYMHENLSDYEWILTIDADSFYYSPAREMPLLTFMDHMKGYGYNVIDGIWYDFRPTEQDDPSKSSHAERMRFCKVEPWRVPQQKIFTYDPSIDFYTSWGHCCYRQKQRVAVIKFLYHHYPWVSLEHGRKKIFKERNPRYVDRKDHPHMHPGYGGKLPIETDLIDELPEPLAVRPGKDADVATPIAVSPALQRGLGSLPSSTTRGLSKGSGRLADPYPEVLETLPDQQDCCASLTSGFYPRLLRIPIICC